MNSSHLISSTSCEFNTIDIGRTAPIPHEGPFPYLQYERLPRYARALPSSAVLSPHHRWTSHLPHLDNRRQTIHQSETQRTAESICVQSGIGGASSYPTCSLLDCRHPYGRLRIRLLLHGAFQLVHEILFTGDG